MHVTAATQLTGACLQLPCAPITLQYGECVKAGGNVTGKHRQQFHFNFPQ